jgi:hypothetical protein
VGVGFCLAISDFAADFDQPALISLPDISSKFPQPPQFSGEVKPAKSVYLDLSQSFPWAVML